MNILYKYKLLIICVLALIALGLAQTYRHFAYKHITIEFKEMRPLHGHPGVYYKGIKIGRVENMKHNDAYTHSLVKAELYPKNLKLPQNTGAILKKEKKKKHEYDYIELIYPKKPSGILLQNKDVIKGKTTVDIESYMANQDTDSLDAIKQDIAQTVKDLDTTINALGDLFVIMSETVNENRPNLKNTTENVASASENLNRTTLKFNRAVKQKQLDNTLTNLDITTTNIKTAAGSLGNIAENIDKITSNTNAAMPAIENAISNGNCILENLNSITCGIKNTLKKPFGGIRILFGKSINEK